MRKLIILLAAGLVASISLAKDNKPPAIKEEKAGMITSFRKEFLDDYRNQLNTEFLEIFRPFIFPSEDEVHTIQFKNLSIQISSLNITQSYFDQNKTIINFHEKKPNFEIKLSNSTVGISFKYKIMRYADHPELENSSGSGFVKFINANITLLSDFKIDKAIFLPQIEELSLLYEDIDLQLTQNALKQGDTDDEQKHTDDSDISQFINEIKEMIKKTYVGKLSKDQLSLLQSYISAEILDFPSKFDIQDVNLTLDLGLIGDGVIVTDNYLSIIQDGSLSFKGINQTGPKDYTQMPIHADGGQDLQVFISQYTLGKMIEAAVELDFFKYYIANQTTDNIDSIISEFEDSFGRHDDNSILMEGIKNMTLHRPTVKVETDKTTIEFYAEVHILNPFEKSYDVAQVDMKLTSGIKFKINSDFMITGYLDTLNMDVVQFLPFYNTTTQAKDIKTRVGFLGPLIQSYCNQKLDDGLQIPIPDSLKKYIKNQKVYNKHGYLLMDADIDFRNFDLPYNETENKQDNNSTIDSSQDNNDSNTDDKNQNSDTETTFVQRRLRQLQDHQYRSDEEDEESHDNNQKARGSKHRFSPNERKEAQDRFYLLVEQVYDVDIKNGKNPPTKREELMKSMFEIYRANDSSNATANWTPEMKETHKQIKEDFKTGKLSIKDLDVMKLAEIGLKVLESSFKKVEKEIEQVGQIIEKEFERDVKVLGKTEKNVEKFFRGIFGG
ncbi:lipid-binding serum glycoprotein family protein [Stylonychia lemnae]|uniref:Lipid-binding serum glycoprotein family protein n=1 Tax=Stylonychia lemnae TaxID=5949 RepID=A0A078AWB1_STYLE|nr:lipid-binding serum glycoprotein family protein [Stylonychia lemnae]|eukprot:CDW85088.1 lipid-binding serum glycoprotein family protein [Stylonychia lemnae]